MTELLQAQLHDAFAWLHRHPETALKEVKTTAFIRDFLTRHGIELLPFPLETGVMAIIPGQTAQPVIALRADIDALPIEENQEHTLRSEHAGLMHACGHDFHTTALLGAALLLKERAASLRGSVKLLFQPAEESSGGAEKVLATGLLDDVDMIFAMHVKPDGERGFVYTKHEADHAAVDKFSIHLRAQGGHAAEPHTTADVIVATSALVQNLQTVVSRSVNPIEPAVLSITRMWAGNTWNVLPPTADLEGTVRTFNQSVRELVEHRVREILAGIATIYKIDADIQWERGVPATNNDYAPIELIKKTATELGMQERPAEPSMSGEDFACYQRTIIGAMWELGVASPQPLHHAGFQADPTLLSSAARLIAEVTARALA